MRDYLLEIACDPDEEDDVLARLFLTASTGSTSESGIITAYFDSSEERDAAMSVLEGLDVEATERERLNWLDVYQQSLKPLFIGERFVVAPDAELIPEGSCLALVVPQEQAFGTGSHETTSLCIEFLETMQIKRGLDVGAGSGILALAMLKLGAEKAIAFDNDPDAYGALRDNRQRNQIDEERMPIFIGTTDALRAGKFEVITMNIIPEVIIPILGDVAKRMSGALIVSGVLTTRRDDVVAAANGHGLRLEAERTKSEWWAGVFRRQTT
ncbi:MAG TPA: 50S ribosomal protein L11 methyltransferase [Thermoanaerobaculia bacterium]|jgi:ribosomal protein L11 methyltransferase|nr:50S ribosomal protein L11 methyltransferase [Thermoanaerobaculia bacterium]